MTEHDDTAYRAGDGDVLAALRGLWDQLDPVPVEVLEAARSAFDWRDVDAALAELILDSRLEEAAIRGADGPRLLTFAGDGLTVEVEVGTGTGGKNLVGQLVPPGPATVTVRCSSGPDHVVEADTLGRFSVPGVQAGPVSLQCRRQAPAGGHALVSTSWITI